MAKATEARVYIFKVALTDAKRIWRRIAIRGAQTPGTLHEAIYKAFDRYDPHLYSFYFPKPGSRGRGRRREAAEYTHPYALEDHPFGGRGLGNAEATKIEELKLEKRQVFEYLFDFGDAWEHLITVEQTDGAVEQGRYPRVLEKRGESPPQYRNLDEDAEE